MKECRYESNGHITNFLDAGVMAEQPYKPINRRQEGTVHPSIGQVGNNIMTIIRGGGAGNYHQE